MKDYHINIFYSPVGCVLARTRGSRRGGRVAGLWTNGTVFWQRIRRVGVTVVCGLTRGGVRASIIRRACVQERYGG